MSPIAMAAAGAGLVNLAWLHYLWLIPREKVPKAPVLHRAAMGIGIGLSAAALVVGPTVLIGILGGVAITLALFFYFLLSRAKQPQAKPTFDVGECLPAISATGADGKEWSSTELDGQAAFIKLFRGHW